MHAHTHMHMHAHMHADTHTHTHTPMHVCTSTYAFMCMHTHTRTHSCKRISLIVTVYPFVVLQWPLLEALCFSYSPHRLCSSDLTLSATSDDEQVEYAAGEGGWEVFAHRLETAWGPASPSVSSAMRLKSASSCWRIGRTGNDMWWT